MTFVTTIDIVFWVIFIFLIPVYYQFFFKQKQIMKRRFLQRTKPSLKNLQSDYYFYCFVGICFFFTVNEFGNNVSISFPSILISISMFCTPFWTKKTYNQFLEISSKR